MPNPPDLPLALDGVSAGTLRRVAHALRTGRVPMPVSAFALAAIAPDARQLAVDVVRLSGEGITAAHLAALLELAAALVEERMAREAAAELVWSGPEAVRAHSRDTLAVLDELFASAQRSVIVSTFVVHQVGRVFGTLAARLDAVPDLHARLFLHVERRIGDTRAEDALLHEQASRLADGWPGRRRPEAYYDPRGLSTDAEVRASWHAKCVLVDDEVALVTSANFTEWAQQRNVEAGALVRSRYFTQQLRAQLDGLVDAKQLRRLMGF
jgi:phosphatidylserine/phosphatidylglycerophosphate/cardiolipin synthase-like enzyme